MKRPQWCLIAFLFITTEVLIATTHWTEAKAVFVETYRTLWRWAPSIEGDRPFR